MYARIHPPTSIQLFARLGLSSSLVYSPHAPRPMARVYYKEYFFPDSLVDGLSGSAMVVVVGGSWWVVLVGGFGGIWRSGLPECDMDAML